MKRSILLLAFAICSITIAGASGNHKCLTVSNMKDGMIQYVDKSKGISFAVYKDWEITCNCDGSSDGNGCIGLRPKNYLAGRSERPCDDSTWMVTIKVYEGSWEKWLKEGGFKADGVMFIYTREKEINYYGTDYALAIKENGWSGLLGERNCGCWDQKHGRFKDYSTRYGASTAMISDGRKTAIIEFNIDYIETVKNVEKNYIDVVEQFLGSFTFRN